MADSIDLKPRGAGRGKRILLVGCVSMLILGVLVVGIGALVIKANWRTWTATGIETVMAASIRDMNISNEEKAAMVSRVAAITEEFRSEALSLDDLQRIGTALAESPMLPVAVVEGVQTAYITPSALTETEKSDARRLNERLARGLFEKRITPEELEPVLKPLSKDDGPVVRYDAGEGGLSNGFQLRIKPPEQVTVEELRAFMAGAESLLVQKAIPDEPFEVDFVAEFDKAVESAIGRRIIPNASEASEPEAEPTPAADPGPQ